MTSAASTLSEPKRRFLAKALSVTWKALVVILAVPLGIIASNSAGWNLGVWLLGPASYAEGLGGFLNHGIGMIGLLASMAILYFIERISRWLLIVFVPMMLYFALVAGLWNGVSSNFDTSRLASIQHHFANTYVLRHMRPENADLTCHDPRISMTDDAKAFCAAPR